VIPGTGWGCTVCGLPLDGAQAVLCDRCVAQGLPLIRFACLGYPLDRERVPVVELCVPFRHDLERHRADDLLMEGLP